MKLVVVVINFTPRFNIKFYANLDHIHMPGEVLLEDCRLNCVDVRSDTAFSI